MSENAGTILILGDNSANKIDITDTGGTASGTIGVFCDGQLFHNSGATPITDIRIRARGGNDHISYTLGNGLPTRQIRRVLIDLGSGQDFAKVTLAGTVNTNARVKVQVVGGTTSNRIKLIESGSIASNASVVLNASVGGDANKINVTNNAGIASGGLLNTNVSAAGNLNLINIKQANLVLGQMMVNASFGGLYERIVDGLTLNAGSTGLVTANVQGGPGNDFLKFVVRKKVIFDPVGLDVTLNGGGGTNNCFRTANVSAQNCAFDHVLP
jgi:hypothetical protein